MTYPHSPPRSSAPAALRRSLLAVALLLFAALASLAAAPLARAAPISDSEELVRFGSEGSAAGQLKLPSGLATDPVTGHVYAAGNGNSRIDEFTPWGEFVKAFGWDVAPGPVNEQQEVRLRAAAGQFKLSFGAGGPGVSETGNLPFDATATEVQTALNSLTNISTGGGSVSVEAVAGVHDGTVPIIYVIAFKGSALEGEDQPQLAGTSELSGGAPTTVLEVRTRADGHPATTGLESCTAESGCQAGAAGPGAGQLSDNPPPGIAVDAAGEVFVKEPGNLRVQKFDSAGRFLLMFGGEVDKTTHANRCTAADLTGGDVCGVGVAGAGNGQFGAQSRGAIAISPAGKLYVADVERFQRFDTEGEYEAQAPVPGENLDSLAFDPIGGALYATFNGAGGVHKLDATTGAQLAELEGQSSLATDRAGDLFAEGAGDGGEAQGKIAEYGPTGAHLDPYTCCEAESFPQPGGGFGKFNISALATNAIGDLYVAYYSSGVDSFVRSFGPGPLAFEAPPAVPPQITAQFASSVQPDAASVAAEINPHFFTDTRYYVQYGTGRCAQGGCEAEEPPAPGALLTSHAVNRILRTADIALQGLNPGTTYHYRFVAQSSAGGPVFGEEASFTTPEPLPRRGCANDNLRSAAAAQLPDCRAYEMVSPLDKNNGDVLSTEGGRPLEQSAEDGEGISYSSFRSFGDPEGAPLVSQYLARRDPETGWHSEAIDPSLGPSGPFSSSDFRNPYDAFSPDLCQAWFVAATEPLLDPPRDFPRYPNLYRRDLCGEEADEALIPVKPTIEPLDFQPDLQGFLADGKDAVFRAQFAPGGPWQAYYTDASGGEMSFLCILPDGTSVLDNCSAGTSADTNRGVEAPNRMANVAGALSADGSKVYWSDSAEAENGSGTVYLRLNPGLPESGAKDSKGNCIPEPERACTLPVSTLKTPKAARFLAATPDGEKALFRVTEGPLAGNLDEFTLGFGVHKLAAKVLGVAAASTDLSRIYFVSEEVLTGSEENANKEAAKAGKPNLYDDDEGAMTFIAELSKADVPDSENTASDVASIPFAHAARATADGSALAFISTLQLTGYDNTDQGNGEADSEVYLYRAGAGASALVCVSCNPSGARPRGRLKTVENNGSSTILPTASLLPLPLTNLHVPRALSSNGNRLFFDSFDALLPPDTNGKEDVYEWEAASSKDQCEEVGAGLYVQSSGGCLSLISSGESPQDSQFFDASSNGDDVFFTTNQSLLPRDPGLIDVYDARVGGGFPEPTKAAACEGEACQSPPTPPNHPTPASSTLPGNGNVEAAPPKPRCGKGKVRRKGRCIARHPHKHRRAHHKRRGPR